MPKKALDQDYLQFHVMTICYKLGKTEQEVATWSLEQLYRWVAYFRLVRKAEERAQKEAMAKAKRG